MKKLILLILLSTTLSAQEVPNSMAALGDSISSGVLASYSLKDAGDLKTQSKVLKKLLNLILPGGKDKLREPHLSWSTGLDPRVRSHAKYLKELNPNIKIFNIATPSIGHRDILKNQLPALHKWSKENLNQAYPDYLTILVGANDVCDISEYSEYYVQAYAKTITASIEKVLSTSPRSKILLLPIPQIDRLHDTVRHVAHSWKIGFKTCNDVWKKTRNCRTVMQERYLHLSKRYVVEFNDSLEQVTAHTRAKFGDRVRLATARGELLPNASAVSFDCFHPNIKGQNLLADKTWPSSWWHQSE